MTARQRFATLLLCIGSLSLSAQTAAPPTPTQTLHVSRSTTIHDAKGNPILRLFGTLNGQHVELESQKIANSFGTWRPTILEPGDYTVRLVDEEKRDGGVRRTYELQLSTGKTEKYDLAGLSE